MRRPPRAWLPLVGLAAAAALGACSAETPPDPDRRSDSAVVLPDSAVAPLLERLARESVTPAPASRLAEGMVAPTNRWFSGLVFGDEPQPVFPLPLSFALTDGGFAFGVPKVVTTERVIAGPFAADVVVENGSGESEVVAYDDVVVTVEQRSASGDPLGLVTIARGSPTVGYRAAAAHELGVPDGLTEVTDGVWSLHVGGSYYGLVAPPGSLSEDGGTLRLDRGDRVNWFASPDADIEALADSAGSPLESGSVAYSGGADPATRITYQTVTGEATLFARMPHQRGQEHTGCELGTFPSVWGELELCSGTALEWSTPGVAPDGGLDLGGLTDEDRELLVEHLAVDAAEAAAIPALPADTYFGGKALYRLATLLDLADTLGETAAAEQLAAKLGSELRLWADPDGCGDRQERCFVYDPEIGGIVGRAPSFGSDEFNDHHFHYGYFLYAAAIAGERDPELLEEMTPVMTLLAADIASGATGSYFPSHRNFDPYGGHSWASGFSPFADGNNHESSAEAVMAWNGLALWADAAGDPALREQAEWMLAGETQSALRYWTNFDVDDPAYDGYGHSIVSLGWGGKREYATWFSDEPTAKLGIQLLPMSPVAGYLAEDPERVRRNVAESGTDGPLGDYILMYQALAGTEEAEAALTSARELPDSAIDDGNSRTYLLAFVLSQLRA